MAAEERRTDALRPIRDDTDASASASSARRQQTHRAQRERWHGAVAVYPPNWDEVGRVDYFYRRDTVLVRTRDADRVVIVLAELVGEEIERREVISGLTRLAWRYGRTYRADEKPVATQPPSYLDEDARSTPDVLSRLDEVLHVGVATPDHALSLCLNGHPGPATEPVEVPSESMDPVPPKSSGTPGWDGDGVLVGVVDGGLVYEALTMWPWMEGVRGEYEDAFLRANGLIRPNSCHGTFVAGCVRCTAPKADVYVKKAEFIDWLPDSGMAYESEIIQGMNDLLNAGADIIVCEFGGDTRLHLSLRSFEVFYDNRVSDLKNVVVMAPAGNDSTRQRTFPAAVAWVVGVGALTANGHRRADFSNFGGWVDVYAPGDDLVNAFAVGDYVCFADPNTGQYRHFEGLAKWSGTSFSTALVAGMIAARMSATGENASTAAEALLQSARGQAIPDVGPVLSIDLARAIDASTGSQPATQDQPEVFVSYHWGGRADALVDSIQQVASERGIQITRDRDELRYRDSIEQFMRGLGDGKAIVIVLDKDYLQSKNCMFELTRIAKDRQFAKRVFPIVMSDAGIFDAIDRLEYVEYWEEKKMALDQRMRSVGQEKLQGIRDDLDLYEDIRNTIAGIMVVLADMNTFTGETHRANNFEHLFAALERATQASSNPTPHEHP